MSRLAEIEAGIAGMAELQGIIQAMRSLAAMRLREAQQTVEGVRSYAGIIADGIAAAVTMEERGAAAGPVDGPTAIIVCASEHGFVGGFNDRIVGTVLDGLSEADRLFVIGARGAALFEERGRPADWTGPMATRPGLISPVINRLSEELFGHIAGERIVRLEAVFTAQRPGSDIAIERRRLLPLESGTWETRRPPQPPLHYLPPDKLIGQLTEDYVFAQLTEVAVESIAAENAARLTATEAADHNIARMLGTLRRDARQARQSEITTELIELVSGAAVAGESL